MKLEQAANGTHDRVAEIVASLTPGSGARAMDAPCGHGGLAARMVESGYSVEAIDLVDLEEVPDGVSFQTHDLNEALPFENESLDLCVSVEGIEHLDRPADFLAEMTRILKPGGELLLSTPNPDSLHSRLRYFKYGFQKNFEPESSSGRDSGHIHPIDRIFVERLRQKLGLDIVAIASNELRSKKFPWTWLRGAMTKRLPETYQNDHVLFGDIIIYHLRKC